MVEERGESQDKPRADRGPVESFAEYGAFRIWQSLATWH